ncbi:MAG TPA: hypothetical protein PKC21_01725 [Oligoflexia bacterium]|nr:hypothetical protein [Oligoflexia bacterium]
MKMIKELRKIVWVILLLSVSVDAKVLRHNEIWSKEYKVQDRYYSSTSNTNNVVAFNLRDGDILIEVDYAKRVIKAFSGVVRNITPSSYKNVKPSLDPKTGNQKVKNILNLEQKQYAHNGRQDRVLEFDVKTSKIALNSKQMHALGEAETISVDLQKRYSSQGYSYFVLLLKIDQQAPIVLLPWKA